MTNKLVGRGQYTLVQLHDGKNMQLRLNSNASSIQSFFQETQTFIPDFSKTGLVITPELYITGFTGNQAKLIKNPVWKINNGEPIKYGGVVSPTSPYVLTISKNMLEYNQLHVTLTCTVTDPDTGLNIQLSSQTSYSKQVVCPLTPTMLLELPNGNLFKNEIYTELTAVCKLMSGTKEINNGLTYTWYLMDKVGGQLITDSAFAYGQGTNTLTVNRKYVKTTLDFKCEICYKNTVYSEFVTFTRQSDQYIVIVENVSGDKMRNGEGVIICEAHLERGGERIDDTVAERKFSFQWFKYNKFTGVKDLNWRNPKTRKIELNKHDIDKLSTFMCEVCEVRETVDEGNNCFPYTLPFILQ